MSPSMEVINNSMSGNHPPHDNYLCRGPEDFSESSEANNSASSNPLGLDSAPVVEGDHEIINDEDDDNNNNDSPAQQVSKPGLHDVLLGRGGGTNNHQGNVFFRKLVNEHKMRYLACSKVDKPKVAREVVCLWRKLTPPGRFLSRHEEARRGPGSVKAADTLWYEVGDKKAREKASQCLRERTPDVLPYIKQLREQQDAITEQGVSLVQQQLQMQQQQGRRHEHRHQQDHQQQHQHPSFTSHNTSLHGPAFPRRNSMPVPHESFQQRPSMPSGPTIGGAMGGARMRGNHLGGSRRVVVESAGTNESFGRCTSLPSRSYLMNNSDRGYYNDLPVEDEFYRTTNPSNGDHLSELEYQHNMMLMQQQLEMQQMQLERLRAQRAMQQRMHASESSIFDTAPSQPMRHGYNANNNNSHRHSSIHGDDFFEDQLHGDFQDPLLTMPAQPVSHTAATMRRIPGAIKRSRDEHVVRASHTLPDTATSRNGNNTTESGELTLEEYRQQLEDYIINSHQQQQEPHSRDGVLAVAADIDDEELEDDWEKEKEKNYAEQRSRGVDRNASGMSMMSAKTTKSNMSMVSGFSGISDLMSQDRETKMNLNRNLSSNLSLMSDMTDLSQNIDTLSIYDEEN
jgi:hypothetical protein